MVADTNRSGVLTAAHSIEMETLAQPLPSPDGIVVQVAACGICGSDMHMWHDAPPSVPLPSVLGHEFAGRVHAVGTDVSGIAVGARVTANPMHSFLGIGGAAGAFADFVHVPKAALGETVFLLPNELSDEEGALIEPLAVALHAIRRSNAEPGQRALILGAGPIGLCVLAGLRAMGITDVAVSDVHKIRLEAARDLGASLCIDASCENVVEEARKHFGDAEIPYCPPAAAVELVFECAGVPQTFDTAIKTVKFGGTIAYVASGPPVALDPNDLLYRELNLVGSFSYVDEFGDAIELMRTKKVDLSALITNRFPLSQIRQAFEHQHDASSAIKTMVFMQES